MRRSNPFVRLLVRGSPELRGGRVAGLPVEKPVDVLRDRYGIPHIFAATEHDLMVAQGFVHAQDRLWQMESLRRLCSGTLAALVGPRFVEVDQFTRLVGLPEIWKRAVAGAGEEERANMEAYAAGVNAYIGHAGTRLPLEFRSIGRAPEPWSVQDTMSFVPYLAWVNQTNYLEKLLALLARERVTGRQWNELFPSHPGAELPEESFFSTYRDARFGKLLPAALALYPRLQGGGGSNAWSCSRGAKGAIFANDPHLAVAVPPVWYFCHLSCPTLEVAGASAAGTPGVVIGRNAKVCWGYTSVMADYTDLYAVRVDPDHPSRYFVKGRTREMEREEVTLEVGGKPPTSSSFTINRTEYGPVLTSLEHGVTAAACLKWYGSLAEKELEHTTIPAYFAVMKAGSVAEAIDAAEGMETACYYLNTADAEGHIGWQAMGRIPVRKGYSGRVPADGSSGACRWSGFVPYAKLPHTVDPKQGWVANANQRTQTDKDRVPLSYSWNAPYRFDRVCQLLPKLENPTAEDFARMQQDDLALQAERLVPTVLAQSYSHPDALLAADLLKDWDFRMGVKSAGALVWNAFTLECARLLSGGILRDDVGYYLSLFSFSYGAVDRLLEPGSDQAANPLLLGRSLPFICEEALVASMRLVRRTLGSRRRGWKWGRLHTYYFRHLGASGGIQSWLLNRGRYPAPGGATTLNVGLTNPAVTRAYRPSALDRFEVDYLPSLRVICSPADPDSMQIVGPMGQSGQPGSRHYDDLLPLWRGGRYVKLPLTRQGAEAQAVSSCTLVGEQGKA